MFQIESNGLVGADQPLKLADAVLNLERDIRKAAGARAVLVGLSLERKQETYLSKNEVLQQYKANAHQFNNFLAVVSQDIAGIEYWKHRGMSETDIGL